MSPNDTVACGLSCGKNVTKSTGGISCARCLKWFHIACVQVSTEQLNFLQKSKGKFLFECEKCTGSSSEVSDLRDEVRKSNDSIHFKLDALLTKVGNYDEQIKELTDDIKNCNQLIKYVDDNNCIKIKDLEDKNEILQRRFNRPDIIINGLPRKDIKLCDVVLKIFNFLDVNISFHDLNVCTYINNRKCVLVKFNSLLKRDAVMHNYFKKGKIVEADILKNNGVKRIYLNDHLTEKGGKLNRLCRDLRKDNTIAKFRLLNSDLPRVKIHFKDATEKIFEYEECFKHFNFGKRQQEIEQVTASDNSPVNSEVSTSP